MDIYQTVTEFYNAFQGEKRIIGSSLLGRNLYAIKVGDGSPVGIATYAIHAREWITALLALEQAAFPIVGSVWFVPLLNPDGALLSQMGRESASGSEYEGFLSAYSREQLRLWKANARGVDLNVNFDAEWGKGEKNVRENGAENGIGARAFSEKETRALRDFTYAVMPNYTISYHTKGEEIYWYFCQSTHTCLRDRQIGESLSRATGYPLREAYGSCGGYKDWCISVLGIPSFTVEVGEDSLAHPLPQSALPKIIKENTFALSAVAKAVQLESERG